MTLSRPFDLVIFDFDGTLVDSHEGIVAAMNAALAAVGAPPLEAAAIAPHIGRPLLDVIRAVLPSGAPEATVDRVRRAYRTAYVELAPGLTRLFPGVREGLEALRAAGVHVAVASNKSASGLLAMIAHLAVEGLFDAVVAADDVARPKPDTAMLEHILRAVPVPHARVAMVGDSRADIGMGRAAGITTVGVTWGAQDRAALSAEGATLVVDTVSELFAVLSPDEAP